MKLSFAIPTYNRAALLKETIENIAEQIGDNKDIDIVVSDNASTDNTNDIIKELQIKYPYIKYFRNETNLGMDKNFYDVVAKATGKYVWLLGDDDRLNQGALNKVLDVIKKHEEVSWIYVNFAYYDSSLTKILKMPFKIPKDYFCNGKDFFKITKFANTTFSTNIVKRELWLQHDFDFYKDKIANHIQSIIPIYTLKDQYAYIISHPYVQYRTLIRSDNNTESIILYALDMLEKFTNAFKQNNYPSNMITNTNILLGKGLLINLINLKVANIILSDTTNYEIKKLNKTNPILYFLVNIILIIPNNIFQLLAYLWKLRKRVKS